MTAAFVSSQPAGVPCLPAPRRHLYSVPSNGWPVVPEPVIVGAAVVGAASRQGAVVPSRSVMRRRQLAALPVVVVIAWLCVQAVTTASAMFGPVQVPSSEAGPVVHVVQPGESLWSIARTIQPSGDIRGFVDQLSDGHGGSALIPGEVIIVSQ